MGGKMAHGLNCKIATPGDVDKYRANISSMLTDYFKRSGDATSTQPKVLDEIKSRIGDDKYLLLLVMDGDAPVGMLTAHVLGERAMILMAYMLPENESRETVKEGLAIFEKWAEDHDAKELAFYTFRHPRSHNFMTKLGWQHQITTYRKEITNGV